MGTNFSRVFALVGGVEDRAQRQEIFLGEVLGHLTQAFKNFTLLRDDHDEQARVAQIDEFDAAQC